MTNRKLCRGSFLERVEEIAKCRPSMLVLREKDLSEEAYRELAVSVIEVCRRHGCPCVLHNAAGVARALGHRAIHLPLPILETLTRDERERFDILGSSCHSLEDARRAEALGCTYIFAGHIFETDCKKGLQGRGLAFLREICETVKIPVFGIGGIHPDNIARVLEAGAAGAAVMSGFMEADSVAGYYADALRAIYS